jgi:putative SOS response-associated peptidase YedK
MCNLYSMTKGEAAIRNLFKVTKDSAGNLPSMPGIFPDYPAPIVRNVDSGRELAMARWGMPSRRAVVKLSVGVGTYGIWPRRRAMTTIIAAADCKASGGSR